jgi:hypothetical protein
MQDSGIKDHYKMIRPLTPTNAGWAQSFDSSGLVSALYEDRENKRKRFEKNIKSFDPNTVWYRDIPEFSKKVNDYYSFISDNYDKLSNKSQNIELWQQMKDRESELMNFSASSKAMGQQVKQAQNLMLQRPELYDTAENRQLIDDVITGQRWGGLPKGYETGEAMNNTFMNQFNRQIHLDIPGMTQAIQKTGAPGDARVQDISDDLQEVRRSIEFDQEATMNLLEGMWTEGFGKASGGEVQKKYGGDFQRFAQEVLSGLKREDDPQTRPKRAESSSGGSDSKFFISSGGAGYSAAGLHGATETVGRTGVLGKLAEKAGIAQPRSMPTNEDVTFDIATTADVKTGGTQTVYRVEPGTLEGYELNGNVWGGKTLTETGKVALSGASWAYQVKQPIIIPEITLPDKDGNPVLRKNYKIDKNTLLSPEMIDALRQGLGSTVDANGKEIKVSSNSVGKFVDYKPFAFARGTSDVSGLSMDNQMTFMNMMEEKQYRGVAVPWEEWTRSVRMPDEHRYQIEQGLAAGEGQNIFASPISREATTAKDITLSAAVKKWLEEE